MDSRAGGWVSHGENLVHSSDWLDVVTADVSLPDGTRLAYEVVRARQSGAAALVVNEAAEVLLIWRHRFIVDRWGWELPAGAVAPGEHPTAAAVREVGEETGWEALEPRLVWSLSRCPERSDHVGHLVLARAGRQLTAPDANEVADIGWFRRSDLGHPLSSGHVHDVFTVAAILWWLNPGTAPLLSEHPPAGPLLGGR